MGRAIAIAAGALLMAPAAGVAADAPGCGGPLPCEIDGGGYRLVLPENARGVVVWFHGYQGSAAAEMARAPLVAAVTSRGLAFAAPDGLGGTWAHPNAPSQARDDIAFAGRVLDDLARRFGFGPEAVVLAGFSQGASMAYYAACAMGPRVSGVVVLSGSFWNPIPEGCAPGFPPLVHLHGTDDGTFPLAGRAIGASYRQGDTRAGLAMLARSAACAPPDPSRPGPLPGLECTVAPGCARGTLTLCLHPGGHVADVALLGAGLQLLGR